MEALLSVVTIVCSIGVILLNVGVMKKEKELADKKWRRRHG